MTRGRVTVVAVAIALIGIVVLLSLDSVATLGRTPTMDAPSPSPSPSSSPQSWAEKAGADWNSAQKALLAGWGILAAVAAALLILLLVLARLATPLFVRPTTVASAGLRTSMWWIGLLLILVASVTPLFVASTALARPSSAWWAVVPFAVTSALLLLLIPSMRRERGILTLFTVTSVAGFGAFVLNLTRATTVPGAAIDPLVVLGVAAAVIGVALVAFAQGTVLVLELQVNGTGGGVDVAAGELLLSRLAALGSERPTGLRVAGASDVSALPESALTSVPGGTWAALLFNVLRVGRPGAPWRIAATFPSNDRITWAITRNAVAAGSTRIVLAAEIPEVEERAGDKPAADIDRTKDELLTACAAGTLVILSQSHRALARGLCGAATWQSLALYAVAVRQSTGPKRKRELLLASLDADPDYALACLALVDTLDDSDAGQRVLFARKLSELRERGLGVVTQGDDHTVEPGYEAYQLRLTYRICAAWLNVHQDRQIAKASDAELSEAWSYAAAAGLELHSEICRITRRRDRDLADLVRQLTGPANNMVLELNHKRPRTTNSVPDQIKALVAQINVLVAQIVKPAEPVDRAGFYSRACYYIGARGYTELALDDLQEAATDSSLRQRARSDPYFHQFWTAPPLDKDAAWVRYARAVGEPPVTDYLELSPFKQYAEKLRALGLTRIDQLGEATRAELVASTGAHRTIVQSMLDIARLATQANRDGQVLDVEILQVLLEAGVGSPAQLRARINPREAAESFYGDLVKAALPLSIVPTRKETVDRWTA